MNGTLPLNTPQNLATEAQIAYLNSLVERLSAAGNALVGEALHVEVARKIEKGSLTKREASLYIDRIRTVLGKRAESKPWIDAPSDEQITFMKDLLAKISMYDEAAAKDLRDQMNDAYMQRELTRRSTSDTIGELKKTLQDLRDRSRAEGRFVSERRSQSVVQDWDGPVAEVPSGCYAVPTEEGHLAFYRVTSLTAKEIDEDGAQFSPDVQFTVELQVSESFTPLPWKNGLTILRKIEAAGVLEASIAYGKHMKVCGVCGTKITNPKSRERGIGPFCFDRLSR